jgi:uncharacterized protein YegP (UPF0339 family)
MDDKHGPSGPKPLIEMAEDAHGNWHWCLWSANGRALATNADPFTRRNDCEQSITAVKKAISSAAVVIATQPPSDAEQQPAE